MSDRTSIEWADATWNPVTGCTQVSPGCDNCYALTLAERFRGTPGHYFEHGFDVQLRPDKLDQPLRWRKPRRVFVNSMSDLFHDDVPDEYIARVWAVMAYAPHHTFQILTKRHGRMRSLLSSDRFRELFDIEYCGLVDWAPRWPDPDRVEIHHLHDGPLPNVWIGVSVENQQWADIRVPALLGTPAAVRFLSCEPLLGPVKLNRSWLVPDVIACGYSGTTTEHHAELARFLRDLVHEHIDPTAAFVDWVIVGGESGRGARPMHPAWARSLRDQCQRHQVPFLFKQWGEWRPSSPDGIAGGKDDGWLKTDGTPAYYANRYRPDVAHVMRVGKKLAGRELDGRTWDEFPGGDR